MLKPCWNKKKKIEINFALISGKPFQLIEIKKFLKFYQAKAVKRGIQPQFLEKKAHYLNHHESRLS